MKVYFCTHCDDHTFTTNDTNIRSFIAKINDGNELWRTIYHSDSLNTRRSARMLYTPYLIMGRWLHGIDN